MKSIKSSKLLTAACALSLAMGVAGTGHADHKGVNHGNGPQLSINVEAFCGDPMAVEYDMYGEVVNIFTDKVAVRLTDVSDDNGPADAAVGNLTIVCTAAVKQGRGKPNDVTFATISVDDPGFGVIETYCPGGLPQGATEWKVTATASGGLRRDVSDTCEEVAAP